MFPTHLLCVLIGEEDGKVSGHLGPRLLPQLQPLHALETESLGHRVGEAVRGFPPECALGCQVSWKWAVKRSGWCVCVCVCVP